MARKVDDPTYSKYLLQPLNLDDLKQICRDFGIKGFSSKKKAELIDLIIDSLSEEELKDLIKEKELLIISEEIDLALKKINGQDRETLDSIKIVNEKNHEIELLFKGWNWEVTSYLSIRSDNIGDPERDCDCRIGSNMGFCSHFWVGFIFSLKEKYLALSDWNLTALPKDFDKMIQKIKISAPSSSGDKTKGAQKVALIDESSDTSMLMKLNDTSVTLYEGIITDMVQRQSDFQGNLTTFYHVTLKDVRLGPRVTKKSDIKHEDIMDITSLKIRISDNVYSSAKLTNGMKISANGKLEKDNFWGFLVKNIRKVDKI